MTESLNVFRLRRAWKIALIGVLMALLTWLFLRAGGISPQAHNAYMALLRQYQHHDEQLNAKVVASYAGLVQNYDGMAYYHASLRETGKALQAVPAWLDGGQRRQLETRVGELLAAQQEKALAIDRFQRANSVLRNSTLYLPVAAELLLAGPDWPQRQAFEGFVRRLSSALLSSNRETVDLGSLRAELLQLLGTPDGGPRQTEMKQLLIHAQVILERAPVVSALVDQIVRAPTAGLHEGVTSSYLDVHQSSLALASYY